MENTTLPRGAQETWGKRGREDFKSQKSRTSVAVRQSALRGKGVGGGASGKSWEREGGEYNQTYIA